MLYHSSHSLCAENVNENETKGNGLWFHTNIPTQEPELLYQIEIEIYVGGTTLRRQ